MGTLGQTLRAAREEHVLSLAQCEAATHIRRQYLMALEADRSADLPAPVYARAYIRTYAKLVGLDPEEMIALFDQGRPQRDAIGVQPEVRPPRMQGAITGRTLIGIIVIAVVAVASYYLYNQYTLFVASGESEINVTLPQAPGFRPTPMPAFAAPAAPEAKPTPSPLPTPAPPTATAIKGVHLEVKVKANSWLSVTVDSQIVYQGIPPIGSTLRYDGNDRVLMRTGNAAGVEITFNGKSEGSLGAPGEVKDVQWTAAN